VVFLLGLRAAFLARFLLGFFRFFAMTFLSRMLHFVTQHSDHSLDASMGLNFNRPIINVQLQFVK